MNERTIYRVNQVIMHTKKIKKHKEKRLIASLLSASFILLTSLICMFNFINIDFQSSVTIPGLYGAVLLFEDAGGYVFAGIAAFILGIVITVVCTHFKDKK